MPESLQETFSSRQYLETYYPAAFDQEKFFVALQLVKEALRETSTVNVQALATKTGLSTEEGENAAIFSFLCEVSGQLLRAFPDGQATLLDVGGGPTIYQHIPFCLHVSSLIHGEYLPENRREVLAYLNREEGAYSWEQYFTVIKAMLQKDEEYQKELMTGEQALQQEKREHAQRIKRILESSTNDLFEKRLREVLQKNVVGCDVFSSSLESQENQELADIVAQYAPSGRVQVVSAHFLVESATHSVEQWRKGVKNLMDMIVPGGFLIMTAIRHATWYRVGARKVSAVSVDESMIRKFLEEHGMVIECIQIVEGSDQERHGYDGMVFVFAQKIS